MWAYIKLLAMDEGARERLSELLVRVKGDRPVRQFAKDVGISLGAMQNWLEGNAFPSAKNLEKIAVAAGMSIEELFAELRGEVKTPPPKKAEDVFQSAILLEDEEQRRLIKLLVDRIGRN